MANPKYLLRLSLVLATTYLANISILSGQARADTVSDELKSIADTASSATQDLFSFDQGDAKADANCKAYTYYASLGNTLSSTVGLSSADNASCSNAVLEGNKNDTLGPYCCNYLMFRGPLNPLDVNKVLLIADSTAATTCWGALFLPSAEQVCQYAAMGATLMDFTASVYQQVANPNGINGYQALGDALEISSFFAPFGLAGSALVGAAAQMALSKGNEEQQIEYK